MLLTTFVLTLVLALIGHYVGAWLALRKHNKEES